VCFRKIFFEAHGDWDEALFCLKILANTICAKSHGRCEHYTMWDEGSGSTGKGTVRALLEKMLGTFTGSENRGYCAVMEKASFEDASATERGKLSPNAQMANINGSCLAWLDDFEATHGPLSASKLRRISGGNNLTAARKGKDDEVFMFNGMLVMICNGLWTISGHMEQADLRRFARQQFLVTFHNEPRGPMQRQKDKSVKDNVGQMVPEMWWLVICYHHIRQARPTLDRTMPLPPTVLASLEALLTDMADASVFEVLDNTLLKFIALGHIFAWDGGEVLPKTCSEIEQAFAFHCVQQCMMARPEPDTLRDAMRRVFVYKPAFTVKLVGSRQRKTMNVYVNAAGVPMTCG
jgi:hypothetical protein